MRNLEQVYDEFREKGYARLGVIADSAKVTELRNRADDIMLGRVTYDGMFFQKDTETSRYEELVFGRGYEGPSLNYRKIEKLEKDPLFFDWITKPLFREVATALVGPEITLYRALIFNKNAETGGSDLPWHQDGGEFWGLDITPTLQIWTGLDDAPLDGGCIEVFEGSHKNGLATSLGGVVPKHLVERESANEKKVLVPTAAGEVLLIHNQLWHRSGPSKKGHARRAFTACYMDAKTRCLRKKRAPREFLRLF